MRLRKTDGEIDEQNRLIRCLDDYHFWDQGLISIHAKKTKPFLEECFSDRRTDGQYRRDARSNFNQRFNFPSRISPLPERRGRHQHVCPVRHLGDVRVFARLLDFRFSLSLPLLHDSGSDSNLRIHYRRFSLFAQRGRTPSQNSLSFRTQRRRRRPNQRS